MSQHLQVGGGPLCWEWLSSGERGTSRVCTAAPSSMKRRGRSLQPVSWQGLDRGEGIWQAHCLGPRFPESSNVEFACYCHITCNPRMIKPEEQFHHVNLNIPQGHLLLFKCRRSLEKQQCRRHPPDLGEVLNVDFKRGVSGLLPRTVVSGWGWHAFGVSRQEEKERPPGDLGNFSDAHQRTRPITNQLA